jgi:NAD(P)-dependent dehydrogenase (short-subunit alcohol dehydrogenase family)
MLDERQILLSLQKKELKMREAKLVEEHAHGLHSFDECDLSAELEELHALVAGAKEEHAVESGNLAVLVVEASNTLMDLGMLPVREVPKNPKKAQEVSKVVGVIMERL